MDVENIRDQPSTVSVARCKSRFLATKSPYTGCDRRQTPTRLDV
jgi:hypothetical protein